MRYSKAYRTALCALQAAVVTVLLLLSAPSFAAPSITSQPPTTATVGELYVYELTAIDEDDDDDDDDDDDNGGPPLMFFPIQVPGWLSLNGDTLSGTPGLEDVGDYVVVLGVRRGNDNGLAQTFTIVVAAPPNAAATLDSPIAPDPQSATEGESFNFDVAAFFSDPDGDVLSFSAPGLPSGLAISQSGVISGTPADGTAASSPFSVTVNASDGAGPAASDSFTLNVTAANSAPILGGAIEPDPQSATEGEPFSFPVASFFDDPDGDALRFTASGLPNGLSMSPEGNLSGTPGAGTAGNSPYTITVNASDGVNPAASDSFTLNVTAVNRAPVLERPIEPDPQSATEGEPFSFALATFFADPDGDALSFTASGLPSGLSMSPEGNLSGTPATGTSGNSPYTVTVNASDGANPVASDSFTLNVTAVNRAPVLDGQIEPDPQSATEGESYRFDAGAFFSDPDGDTLTFTASGLPPSFGIAAENGVISGTPGNEDIGSGGSASYTIRVTASDGNESVSDAYDLNITGVDEPPSLPDPGPSLSTPEDTPLKLTPALLDAVDEDVNRLTVVLTPPPSDADFTVTDDGTTVRPRQNFTGTLSVEARVRDAGATSNAVTVAITVTPVNDAPTIESVPDQSATEGESFSLNVAQYVDDVEDDALSYRADELPPGMTIDAATGVISGTVPVGTAAGDYDVRLNVTDGSDDSSAQFRISILAAGRADLVATAAVAENPVLVNADATWTLSVTNNSSIDVGNVLLEAVFTGNTPFQLDPVTDGSCTLEPQGNDTALQCRWSPLPAGASQSVEVSGRANQAGEVFVASTVSIEDAVPIDETSANDTASAGLNVTERLSSGPSQQLNAPGAVDIAVGDFNADELEDIAVATGAGEPTLVFLNGVDPDDENKIVLSSMPISAGEATAATGIASGDLDGDGNVDLVVANADAPGSVLVNGGAASFTASTLEPATGTSNAVAITDLDGDGLLDIVFANQGPNAVYLNRGGMQFVLEEEFGPELSVDVAAANLLEDSLPELVFANSDSGATIYRSVNGVFTPSATIDAGPTTSVAATDFDGDGALDLVFGRAGSSVDTASNLVYLNNSTASASFFLAEDLGGSPTADVLADDFNGDAGNDIVSINASGSHQLYTNSGAAVTAFLLHPEQFAADAALAAAKGHFSADSRIDVAVAGADKIAIFFNDGLGNLGGGDAGAPTLTLVGEPTVTITVGDTYTDAGATASDDLDGDLTDDIVVNNPVEPDVIGTYTVTYDVVDSSGNAASTLERTVQVQARSGTGGGGGGAFDIEFALLLLFGLLRRSAWRPTASATDNKLQ